MKKIALDLGGSETKVAIGESSFPLSVEGSVVQVDVSTPVKDYIEDKYSDFIIVDHPRESLRNCRYLKGESKDHFEGKTIYCDNQSAKTEQDITYINAAYAVALMALKNGEEIEEGFKLGVCIPTAEYYANKTSYKDVFKKNMTGKHTISFPLLGKTISFELEYSNILVCPEGVVYALIHRSNTQFKNGNTLIVDVGHRSTDVTVLEKFRPVGRAAASRPIGGIVLEALVRNELERDNKLISKEEVAEALRNHYIIREKSLVPINSYIERAKKIDYDNWVEKCIELLNQETGTIATPSEINKAYNNYFIMSGNGVCDITETVNYAKETFSSQVYDTVIEVLSLTGKNIGSINNVVLVGRPFEGDYTLKGNLANMLLKRLGNGVNYYPARDLKYANVEEIIKALG